MHCTHLLALVDRGVQCVGVGLPTRLSRVEPRPVDSGSWFVELVGGDYVSRTLVCGDSLGDVENGTSAEAFGLGENQPWRLKRTIGLNLLVFNR